MKRPLPGAAAGTSHRATAHEKGDSTVRSSPGKRPTSRSNESGDESIVSKIAFRVFAILGVWGPLLVSAKFFPDAPLYGPVVAVCIGAGVAIVAAHVFSRLLGEPGYIDLSQRGQRWIAIGLALALALSMTLLIQDIRGAEHAARSRKQAEKERDERHEQANSPHARAAAQRLQQIEAFRQRQAASRPATSPAVR